MHRSRTGLSFVAAAAALLGLAATGSAATASKPQNQSPPTISGDAAVGKVLNGHLGTWSGNPTDFNTWWKRCNSNGGHCSNIAGTGGSANYQVHAADEGHRLRFSVGAANSDGRTWAQSSATGVVATLAGAPVNTSPPRITGSAVEGATLTGHDGHWAGNPNDFNTWWQRCNTQGAGCANIPGSGGHAQYRLQHADVGTTIRYAVGAANAHGRTWTSSAQTATIAASATPQPVRGCPSTSSPDDVSTIGPPARLYLNGLQAPSIVTKQTQTLVLRFHVTSTCGGSVRGALVSVSAVPFFQFQSPPEQISGSDGWVEIRMQRQSGFPVGLHQQLIALYARARKPGDSPLSGISTARLFSVRVDLHA